MIDFSSGDPQEVVSKEDDIYYNKIPRTIRVAIQAHFRQGRKSGDFVECLLENDFTGAVGRADVHNSTVLKEIATYLHNKIPADCWGSREKVQAWRLQQHSNDKFAPWERAKQS